MPIYLCRWPNGEFSIVNAKSKDDAIELLDEWGNAEQASLTRMADCMFDFRLDDDGQIQLASIGESTYEHVMEACYPELDKAFATAERDENKNSYSARGRERIRMAVQSERTRLWEKSTRKRGRNTIRTRNSKANGGRQRGRESHRAGGRWEEASIAGR